MSASPSRKTVTKSILKKDNNIGNKTRKRVIINTELNEGYIKNPDPITPVNKHQRWTTRKDEQIARENVRSKKRGFEKSRRESPFLAAMTARRKFNLSDDDHIQIKRTHGFTTNPSYKKIKEFEKENIKKTKKGPISSAVRSVFSFFTGKKGGKKTRKNRK
jgi:hypothetical protein